MDKNYDFFVKADLSKYVGEWIAICNGNLVSHGRSVKRVFSDAKRKCPKEKPLLTKVPEKAAMIF